MKSTTGHYFIGLDHVRALAALIVFTWHFIHVNAGQVAPPPLFPLSILTEGHTGVALFMTLSGYLFAKLLDGKVIRYTRFFWNRILRLAPLLVLVILIVGVQESLAGKDIIQYAVKVAQGAVMPTLPNGGWSITTEFHFYLLLPLLLFLSRKWTWALLGVIAAAVLLRVLLYHQMGQIQTLSYWTIVGRIDQFVLGMLAFQFRALITGRHLVALGCFILFAVFYWYFDSLGGFYKHPSYPSPSRLWIGIPTVEGAAYAILISWYDNSFRHSTGKVSRFVAQIGTYSYSIYLLHFFVVFQLANFIDMHLVDLSNLYLRILVAFLAFLLMVPAGYFSYRYIESPFLTFRKKYFRDKHSVEDSATTLGLESGGELKAKPQLDLNR